MKFSEVLPNFLNRQKIRRKRWAKNYYFDINDGNRIFLNSGDVSADDWELYEEIRLSDLKPGETFKFVSDSGPFGIYRIIAYELIGFSKPYTYMYVSDNGCELCGCNTNDLVKKI